MVLLAHGKELWRTVTCCSWVADADLWLFSWSNSFVPGAEGRGEKHLLGTYLSENWISLHFLAHLHVSWSCFKLSAPSRSHLEIQSPSYSLLTLILKTKSQIIIGFHLNFAQIIFISLIVRRGWRACLGQGCTCLIIELQFFSSEDLFR